jgi:hypothetical protein
LGGGAARFVRKVHLCAAGGGRCAARVEGWVGVWVLECERVVGARNCVQVGGLVWFLHPIVAYSRAQGSADDPVELEFRTGVDE